MRPVYSWGNDTAQIWVKIFAAGIIILLTFINTIGAEAVTKTQTAVVTIVIIVLGSFAIAMLLQMNVSMLAPSTYPPPGDILASVALTFFAYLGFGVISFSGGDLENPTRNLPKAMYIAIGFTLLLYVALAIGVFGTLTVQEVIDNADTALAAAALPIFGALGYTMISIAAIFATAGATNSQLYATTGITYIMAKYGQLPPIFGQRRRSGGTQGLLISAFLAILLTVLFDVTAIASIGSAVALAIFTLVTVAHLRMANETKASRVILILTLLTTILAMLLFAWYTFITSPETFVILVVTIILAWVTEAVWLRISKREVNAGDKESEKP